MLILCGLHARHPYYIAVDNSFSRILHRIKGALNFGKVAYCKINQISKGIELLTLINKFLLEVEFYIDAPQMQLVHCFEDLKIPVLSANNHPLKSLVKRGVILSIFPPLPFNANYEVIPCDFSLHDDFNVTVNFIQKINPIACVGAVQIMTKADIEKISGEYSGTPFIDGDEVKKVRFISPGWYYKIKNVQISRPRLKEEVDEVEE